MAEMIENVIYILTNPQYPGYIKIGYASNLKQRVSSLNTGALVEFVPYAVYETPKVNGDVEIHKIIELLNPILRASKFNNGKSKLKEFFKLEPEEAYELLEHIATVTGTLDKLYKVTPNYKKIPNGNIIAVPDVSPIESIPSICPNGIYTLDRKIKAENIKLHAEYMIQGNKAFLKTGSIIASTEGSGLNPKAREMRKNAKIKNGVLCEDIPCSFNTASAIVLGRSCNAWTSWKDKDGNIIDKYRKEQNNG